GIAEENPEVQFLIVDQCIDPLPDNVRCAVFKEYEGSFLIGAVAASLTKSNHVGTVCALDIPFMHRFTDGFELGAKYVNPDITVSTLWVGGSNPFSDPVRAKELALALAGDGADHIFAATSGGDYGVFEAAQEKGISAFGVDINQCPVAPGHIVESQLKRVDVAIAESVEAIVNNSEEKVMVYGLDSNGVGLISLSSDNLEESQCTIVEHPEVIEKVKEIQTKILSGEIMIEDPMFKQ
ncbi:MAG: BMP family ABC transporter substrate-binding protein, partial [bacterium]|nr:BMP family ABC transporter substrate-binding protein [bacterium]